MQDRHRSTSGKRLLGLLVLAGLATVVAAAWLLEALRVPRPAERDASPDEVALLLLAIVVIAPLLESWIVLSVADRMRRRLSPGACFAWL